MGVAGAWRLPFSASNLPPEAHSCGGKRSVRALIAASRSGSFAEGIWGDGEALLSSPLLSPSLVCGRLSPHSGSIIRQERSGEAGGKSGVRLLTGDPGSSPDAAFSEIPLCPGGGFREKETRRRAGSGIARERA